MKRILSLVAGICLTSLIILSFIPYDYSYENNESRGPGNGSLLIIGGSVNDQIWDEMKNLMGGSDKHLVVIPTAISGDTLKQKFLDDFKNSFVETGFTNVTVLHTRDRNEANSEEFIKPLKSASCVWFSGGRQWRHADSYLNTKTHEAFKEVLKRGGLIAGSSAGATIQGSYLARGDTKANTIMMGDHEEGLGFLTNVAIDQHLLARNRQFDMFEILDYKPELLGIGIDEKNTAIIVKKNRFRVIGESYVSIYDGTRWSAERDTIYQLPKGSREFYVLKAGDEYDLEQRKVVQMKDRIFVKLPKDSLSNYVGNYFDENEIKRFEIISENDTLKMYYETYDWKIPLLPESSIKFFDGADGKPYEFQFNSTGEVTELYSLRSGKSYQRNTNEIMHNPSR